MPEEKIVYIVDDDQDIGVALEHLLRAHGYRPRLFASIADFNSRSKPCEAVCLILDIQINGAGFNLKRQLSCSDPGLPVIFITGSDTEENRLMVRQVGATANLPKPFGSKALIFAIENAIRSLNPRSPQGSWSDDVPGNK
jgi:FixJ family two-component response regulator